MCMCIGLCACLVFVSVCVYVYMQSYTCTIIPFHRKLKQLFFFYSGRDVNFLMQLQFLAPVELFFKQLNGYSF